MAQFDHELFEKKTIADPARGKKKLIGVDMPPGDLSGVVPAAGPTGDVCWMLRWIEDNSPYVPALVYKFYGDGGYWDIELTSKQNGQTYSYGKDAVKGASTIQGSGWGNKFWSIGRKLVMNLMLEVDRINKLP